MSITNLTELIRRFQRQRVLVVGDAMLDCYYSGRAERISPEGPVPIVASTTKTRFPGGATNAAANIAALGGKVRCLGVIGADDTGAQLREELRARKIGDDLIVDPARATITKLRIMADSQYVVRFDEGERCELTSEVEEALIARLRAGFASSEAVIVADYCYGVLSPRVIEEIGRLKRLYDRLVLVDSKNLPLYRGMAASVITPNHLEAQRAVGWSVRDVDGMTPAELEQLGRTVLESIGSTWALVTLNAKGSLLFEQGQPTYRVAPRPVAAPHVSGAGDTFTAALALSLAAGAPVRSAVEVAAEAAAVAISKPGTSTVSPQELLQRLSTSGMLPAAQAALEGTLGHYRQAGKRIVFTNGVFDVLQSGHIAFLRTAKGLGDVLVVGVNSDRGVAAARGYAPRTVEQERAAVVAALEMVDHVVLFDEPTPEAIIRAIRPNVHVKGGNYQIEDLPEAEAVQQGGGEVVILPLHDGAGLAGVGTKLLSRERGAGS